MRFDDDAPDDFDVASAARELAKLAQKSPDAPLLLTFREQGKAGIEEESDVRMRGIEASALLESLGGSPILTTGERTLRLIRIARATDPPKPEGEIERVRTLD